MKKLNILLVHNHYRISGGEDTVFQNELEALKHSGHNVYTYERFSDDIEKSFFRIVLLPISMMFNIKTFLQVSHLINKYQIDIIHCHNITPLISPSIFYVATLKNVPIVQTVHNFRLVCPNGLLHRDGKYCDECLKHNSYLPSLNHSCYHNSKIQTFMMVICLWIHRVLGTYRNVNFIFLTKFNLSKFNNFLTQSNRVFVKGNFTTDLNLNRTDNGCNDFIYFGRLEEEKGIIDLITMWKNLNCDFKLHIYGDGTLKDFVEQAAKYQSNIFFYGFQDKKEILKRLSYSKAMIFPSKLTETFGLTIVESFSVGCPVIANNFGNGAMLVKESDGGILYDDYCGFEQAVFDIIEHNNYFSEKAKKFYLKKFTEISSMNELNKIYSLILKGDNKN